jgi:hypothetical protein
MATMTTWRLISAALVAALLIATALVQGVRRVNAEASIFDAGGSTKEHPEFILLLGYNQKGPALLPTYSVWFTLYGQKQLYKTGDFNWFRQHDRERPEGEIAVDWRQGKMKVNVSGCHLYNGDYASVWVPEHTKPQN